MDPALLAAAKEAVAAKRKEKKDKKEVRAGLLGGMLAVGRVGTLAGQLHPLCTCTQALLCSQDAAGLVCLCCCPAQRPLALPTSRSHPLLTGRQGAQVQGQAQGRHPCQQRHLHTSSHCHRRRRC
jgi:hypothetical protein